MRGGRGVTIDGETVAQRCCGGRASQMSRHRALFRLWSFDEIALA